MQHSDSNNDNGKNQHGRVYQRELNSSSNPEQNLNNMNQSEPPIVSVRLNIPGMGQVDGLVRKYPDGSIRVVSIPANPPQHPVYLQGSDGAYYSNVGRNVSGLFSQPNIPIYPIERGMPPVSSIPNSRNLPAQNPCPPVHVIRAPPPTNPVSSLANTNIISSRPNLTMSSNNMMNFASNTSGPSYTNTNNRQYATMPNFAVPPLQRIDVPRNNNNLRNPPPPKPPTLRPSNQPQPQNNFNTVVRPAENIQYNHTNNTTFVPSDNFNQNMSSLALTEIAFNNFHKNLVGVFKTSTIPVNEVDLFNNAVSQWNSLTPAEREVYLNPTRPPIPHDRPQPNEIPSWTSYQPETVNNHNQTYIKDFTPPMVQQKDIRRCLKNGCQNNVEYSSTFGGYYCSEQCAVLHSKSIYLMAYPNLKKVLS